MAFNLEVKSALLNKDINFLTEVYVQLVRTKKIKPFKFNNKVYNTVKSILQHFRVIQKYWILKINIVKLDITYGEDLL